MTGQQLKRTPLYEAHLAAGAKMIDFGGWEMPVQYKGILEEHKAVRTGAGLEVIIRGKGVKAVVMSTPFYHKKT